MAIAGNDISIANTASAVNQITFNPIITALTGTGAVNPTVTTPQTLTNPTTASTSMPESNSLWGGLGLGSTTKPQALIGAGQPVPGVSNPNAIGVTATPNTMIWILLFGGMGMVLLMGGGHHGGRRH